MGDATKFLIYDPATGNVTGVGFTPDGTLPGAGAIVCTDAQHDAWQGSRVTNGAIVAPLPVPLTWDQVLAQKIASGIAITSTGTPTISATYALDDLTMNQIGPVARDFAAGFGLPGGASTFTYPDATGRPRTFTGPQMVALYKAMRDLLFMLNTQAAMMAHGATPSWPTQTATIA
jgi:hypothetical protein